MDHQQRINNSSNEQINEYLSRFKSDNDGLDTADENALDQHLLERAAEELRTAKACVENLNRQIRHRQPAPAVY